MISRTSNIVTTLTEGEQPGTRVLVITETPYVMVYRVRAESIRITAVWHTRQSRKGQR